MNQPPNPKKRNIVYLLTIELFMLDTNPIIAHISTFFKTSIRILEAIKFS